MSTRRTVFGTTTTEYTPMPYDGQHFPIPIAVQAAYALAPVVEARLQIVVDSARYHNLPVHHSFNAPLSAGIRTFSGPERDWHLMPLAEDPAWNHRHGFPMPREVIAQLRKIDAAQMPFTTLYIAHETPKAVGYLPGPVDRSAMLMPPISTKAQQKASSMGELAASLVKAAFAPAMLAGLVGAAALAAPLAAGALVGLDPIIFGVITDPNDGLKPGSHAAWVYLCHWAWE